MNDWKSIRTRVRAITFDCYGTLIDWKAGLASSLAAVFGDKVQGRIDELFDVYVTTEAEVEAEPFMKYKEILRETTKRLAARFGWTLPENRMDQLAQLLPTWRPFGDTNEALTRMKKRFRLGVLSNIDRDLFQGTAGHFSIDFDFVVVAEDVRSYKPELAHFERYLREFGDRETTLHVGQSPYHDGLAAKQVGIPFAWINRYAEPNRQPVVPAVVFPDLKSLADSLEPAA